MNFSKKTNKGFTLVEISVVIGIIAMLSLITIPALVNYQRTTKLRNEARLMATNLRLAQQLAITEQSIYGVEFFPLANNYQITNQGTSEVKKIITLPNGVRISQIDNLTGDEAQFNPTGAAVEIGTIFLVNTQNQTTTVEIKPSGYVQINEQF